MQGQTGIDAVRLLIALARTRGNASVARSYAAAQWGENAPVARALTRFVSTGSFGDDPDYRAIGRGLVEIIRADSVVARINTISPMRRVGFDVPTIAQVEAASAAWTAEGLAIQASSNAFDTLRVPPRKISGLVVFTRDSLLLAGPELESALLADLARAVASMDGGALLDPSNGGDADKPASVTYSAPVVHSTGPTADALRADLRALFAVFKGDVSRAVWLMNSDDALALCLMGDAIGAEGLTVRGGEWFGIPAIASASCPQGQVTLLDPSGVMYADGGVELDMTTEALVTTTNGDTTSQLALWQMNLLACKANRLLSWLTARDGATVYLDGLTFA